jgi:hypothetical protein
VLLLVPEPPVLAGRLLAVLAPNREVIVVDVLEIRVAVGVLLGLLGTGVNPHPALAFFSTDKLYFS